MYGGYDGGDYDDGYGDLSYGYGAYGSRGGRGAGRGGGMRGMGNGRARGRGGRGGRGGGMMKSTYQSTTGHSVHMRGLPYVATESDIVQVRCEAAVMLVVIRVVQPSIRRLLFVSCRPTCI